MSWVKLAAPNFGVRLIPDLFSSGRRYKQTLASGLIYLYKQSTIGTNVFL